jgi:hypothetical protein
VTVPRTKGFRGIAVDGRPFRWRFAKVITVVPDGVSGRQVLEVDFGWFDIWLHANDRAGVRPVRAPPIATPAFVASAIHFALQNGWSTESRGGRFRIEHTAERGFQVSADRAARKR